MATDADTRDFHEQLKAILPRLRVYALSLTRDRDAADDLAPEHDRAQHIQVHAREP